MDKKSNTKCMYTIQLTKRTDYTLLQEPLLPNDNNAPRQMIWYTTTPLTSTPTPRPSPTVPFQAYLASLQLS